MKGEEGRTLQRKETRIDGLKVLPTNGKHAIIKDKDLIGIPWRVAFALQADGWWLRSILYGTSLTRCLRV